MILLNEFTSKHRLDLTNPMQDKDFVYATNGHIAIRININITPVQKRKYEIPINNLIKMYDDFNNDKGNDIAMCEINNQLKSYDCRLEVCDKCKAFDYLQSYVRIFNDSFDWKYLRMVCNAMIDYPGNWKYYQESNYKISWFYNDKCTIALMPLR